MTLLSLAAASPGWSEEKAPACPGVRHMRVSARHIEAGGVGYNKGYTTLETFLAPDPERWAYMPFLDLRGHVFNDGKWAANGGLGVRKIWGCRVYGINAYYDFRNTHHKSYNQVSAGLETLGQLWDLRVNGYLPFGSKLSSAYNIVFGGFRGNSMLVNRTFQYSMKGIDGEIGFHFGKTANFDFYGAAGSYYFKGEIGRGAIGGKLRLAGYFREYITLEISDSFDNVFHNNFQGQITLSLPFGPRSNLKPKARCDSGSCAFATALNMRMAQPVARQEIVVVDRKVKTDPASQFFVFVDNQSSSAGTFESPYPTLVDAQNNSNPGDIIYVFPGDGTTNGMNLGITLQENQQFWGSGTSQSLMTAFGNITIPPQSSGVPQMTNTMSGAPGITLANNTVVRGFTVTTPNGNGIYGDDVNVVISACTLFGAIPNCIEGGEGVFLNYDGTTQGVALLDGLTINNNQAGGILINGHDTSSSVITISNCFISNNLNAAAVSTNAADSSQLTLNITGNTIVGNGSNGINATSSSMGTLPIIYNLSNNYIAWNEEQAFIGDLSGTAPVIITAEQNQIFGGNGNAFSFADSSSPLTLTINNNEIIGQSESAIDLENYDGSFEATITNNTINYTNGSGVNVNFTPSSGVSGSLIIMNNTAAYNNGSGFQILNSDMTGTSPLTVVISNNTLNNNGSSGIYLYSLNAAQMSATATNNTLYNNATTGDPLGNFAGFQAQANTTGSLCIEFTGNNSDTGYYFVNNGTGPLNYAPCDAGTENIGTISTLGTVTPVTECPSGSDCP